MTSLGVTRVDRCPSEVDRKVHRIAMTPHHMVFQSCGLQNALHGHGTPPQACRLLKHASDNCPNMLHDLAKA